jgi:hypothetical protein
VKVVGAFPPIGLRIHVPKWALSLECPIIFDHDCTVAGNACSAPDSLTRALATPCLMVVAMSPGQKQAQPGGAKNLAPGSSQRKNKIASTARSRPAALSPLSSAESEALRHVLDPQEPRLQRGTLRITRRPSSVPTAPTSGCSGASPPSAAYVPKHISGWHRPASPVVGYRGYSRNSVTRRQAGCGSRS